MDVETDLPQDYEQIPWSHLVPVQKDRSLQLVAAVVAIIAVALTILFLMRRSPATIVPIVASTTTAPVVGETVVETPQPEVVASPPPEVAAPLEPRIYSEADLMAALPLAERDGQLEAIARAEWFVTDYFTVDGDAALAAGVSAVLPDSVELPLTDGSAISYVEWARAVDVVDRLDDSFDVTVWFRTLVGDLDGGFNRTDVRAVEVRLVTDEMGRLAVGDVPVVATLAPAGAAPAWPAAGSPSPDLIAAGAAAFADFGVDPELESAGLADDGWRLLFTVGDASGLRFPVVVRLGS